MSKREKTIAEQIRAEINVQGHTAYRVGKETGIHEATVGRFLNHGGGMQVDSLDKIVKFLGMELVTRGDLQELRKLKRKG